jgi:hypothetical protein
MKLIVNIFFRDRRRMPVADHERGNDFSPRIAAELSMKPAYIIGIMYTCQGSIPAASARAQSVVKRKTSNVPQLSHIASGKIHEMRSDHRATWLPGRTIVSVRSGPVETSPISTPTSRSSVST